MRPKFVTHLPNNDELWETGNGIAHVIPGILPTDSPALKYALTVRRTADLLGRCECGGEIAATMRHGLVLKHEDDCPACDGNILPMAKRERHTRQANRGEQHADTH